MKLKVQNFSHYDEIPMYFILILTQKYNLRKSLVLISFLRSKAREYKLNLLNSMDISNVSKYT